MSAVATLTTLQVLDIRPDRTQYGKGICMVREEFLALAQLQGLRELYVLGFDMPPHGAIHGNDRKRFYSSFSRLESLIFGGENMMSRSAISALGRTSPLVHCDMMDAAWDMDDIEEDTPPTWPKLQAFRCRCLNVRDIPPAGYVDPALPHQVQASLSSKFKGEERKGCKSCKTHREAMP